MTDAAAPALQQVVIADDDDDIRLLVEIAVRRAGFEVAAASVDGNQAWAAIQRIQPALVVLDVSMPGFGGLELCRMMRADERLGAARILLLSAGAADEARQAGVDAGADRFVTKPFSPRELAAQLVELLP
jgi:DNA-binding response OmpR family regulator